MNTTQMTLDQAKRAVLAGKRVGWHGRELFELTTVGKPFPLHGGGTGHHWYVGENPASWNEPKLGWELIR